MNRRTLLVLLALPVFAGCGSGDDPMTTAKTTAEPSPKQAEQAAQASYDAAAALGVARGALNVARYCVRKTGAQIGTEQPPSATLVRAKDRYVTLIRRVVKNFPHIKVAGTPLDQYLATQVDDLRSENCDAKLTAAIEDASLSLP